MTTSSENVEEQHREALQRMRRFESYYKWVHSIVRPWIGKRILDAGCGTGNFSRLLDGAELLVMLDESEQNLLDAHQEVSTDKLVQTLCCNLESEEWITIGDLDIDTVVCLDILEHINDDEKLLKRLYSSCQLNGHLIIKVPAIETLYNSIDVASGHCRRYSRKGLIDVVTEAGWKVLRCEYMNACGIVPYFLKGKVLGHQANFSRTFSKFSLVLIDRLIPVIRLADILVGRRVGLSLIIIASKR